MTDEQTHEEKKKDSAGLIHQTIPEVAETEPRLNKKGPRYCVPCDEFMKARVCKACGAETERCERG